MPVRSRDWRNCAGERRVWTAPQASWTARVSDEASRVAHSGRCTMGLRGEDVLTVAQVKAAFRVGGRYKNLVTEYEVLEVRTECLRVAYPDGSQHTLALHDAAVLIWACSLADTVLSSASKAERMTALQLLFEERAAAPLLTRIIRTTEDPCVVEQILEQARRHADMGKGSLSHGLTWGLDSSGRNLAIADQLGTGTPFRKVANEDV